MFLKTPATAVADYTFSGPNIIDDIHDISSELGEFFVQLTVKNDSSENKGFKALFSEGK